MDVERAVQAKSFILRKVLIIHSGEKGFAQLWKVAILLDINEIPEINVCFMFDFALMNNETV